MNPWATWAAKSALTWIAVITLVAAGFALRYAMVRGVFTPLPSAPPVACGTVPAAPPGAADLAIDAAHNVMFVSAGDGLYTVALSDPDRRPQKLAGTSPNFRGGGISLYRAPDGGETLMAITVPSKGRPLIEAYGVSFDGEDAKLTQQMALQSGLLISPFGISAFAPDRFYATNDHAATGVAGRFAEDYLLWPHADVLLSSGTRFRIAAQRIAYPSGILVRPPYLYVAAGNERRIIALSIEDFTGNLTEIGALALPARLGHISADPAGNLIVAGQSRPGSSQVFRVRLGKDGIPQAYDTLFSDDGHVLAGASAAAVSNNLLLIAGAGKILACALKP